MYMIKDMLDMFIVYNYVKGCQRGYSPLGCTEIVCDDVRFMGHRHKWFDSV